MKLYRIQSSDANGITNHEDIKAEEYEVDELGVLTLYMREEENALGGVNLFDKCGSFSAEGWDNILIIKEIKE